LDQLLSGMVFDTTSKTDQILEFQNILAELLKHLKATQVPEKIICKIMDQLFYFVDAQLFNSFLKVFFFVFF
jgi:hypothetical protein